MSTYPRTYDLIHADNIFTLYNNRLALLVPLLLSLGIVTKEKCINVEFWVTI